MKYIVINYAYTNKVTEYKFYYFIYTMKLHVDMMEAKLRQRVQSI